MAIKVKYYTVCVNENAAKHPSHLWYTNRLGEEFKTVLAIVENTQTKRVAAFKCTTPPFFHIYPNHCTVIKEETIES